MGVIFHKTINRFLCIECGWSVEVTWPMYKSPCLLCKGKMIKAGSTTLCLTEEEMRGGEANADKG